MDAKDFIFPGVILALVIIVGIGLLLTHSDRPTLLPNTAATSTDAGTASSTIATTTQPATPTPTSSVQPYGSVTLALGQAATFADKSSIRPIRILGDSRCPVGVQCIQAGTVNLSIMTTANGKTTTETISIGQSIHVGSDTVTFDSVTPQKHPGGYPASSDYRFTFTVTHG